MSLSLRRGALGISLVCVALVSAELAARIDDWIRLDIPILRTPDYNHDLKYQDSFGIRGRLNGRYRRWRLNNFGFRGPDISREPAAGSTRIMLLGASETFGLYESEGKEYPNQLQDSLGIRGRYEVVNAAIAGAGLMAIIRLWENYAADFHPAVVVIYPSPSFYAVDREPTWPPAGRPEQPYELPLRPRLLEQFRNVWQTPEFLQRRRLNDWIAQATDGKPPEWFYRHAPRERLDLFTRNLDSLVKSIRARGALPIVMTHAMRLTVPAKPTDEFLLLDWRSGNPRATVDALLETEQQGAQRVRSYANAQNVCLVDLDRSLSGHSEYFADVAHFTDKGAGVVAGLITHQLTDDGESRSFAAQRRRGCGQIPKPRSAPASHASIPRRFQAR